jgi:glucose-6-phosphate 1-dehydrogenase
MTDEAQTTLPTVLVIFGATGDLTRRKLVPALWHLYRNKQLPALFQVVGFSRQDLSDEDWQKQVRDILEESQVGEGAKLSEFIRLFSYRAGVFEDPNGYEKLATLLGKQDKQWHTCANKLFYLAVPPQFYSTIFDNLAASGLTEPCGPDEGWTRVIVEKPFGKDLETAQELDAKLGRLFKEEQIYRIDHYLGKETTRNILAFRFSNTFLDPSWNNRSIASMHVHFPEQAGIQGRGEFYDGIGALRDVGQNHMLQLLALFLMENPGAFDAESIRRERTKVLEALESLDDQDIVRRTVRGHYQGYRQIEGVAPDSKTETYFRVQTEVNLPRWRGMPIFLESGKALDQSKFEITVQFRHHTPCLCPSGQHYTNVLRYRVQPDEGVFMSFWVKKPGPKMDIEEKEFAFDYHQAYQKEEFVDAYVKLLLDAIAGDQTLFVSTDEITASWRFIDPIVRAWFKDAVPLVEYKAGSTRDQVAAKIPAPVLGHKDIGYVGLGKMGQNMVARLIEHQWNVVATDPIRQARAKTKAQGAKIVSSASAVIKSLAPPRLIWLMIPHQAVDEVLKEILPLLKEGDTVVDGGNSFYKKSVARAALLAKKKVHFLDVGVSGGPSGARTGACLMVGGERQVYKMHTGLFNDLSAAGGYDYMGEAGAGHFVKMVHNGIEYGMMQAIGEGFAVMRKSGQGLNLERVANLFNHRSVIESRLVGWLKDAYDQYGPELRQVSGTVAHSGEGQWTVEAAKELGVPVPIIEGALQLRMASQKRPSYTGQVLSALRHQFGGHDVKKQ